MKKTDPRWDDMSVTESCGNVFIDLGFDEAEAKVMSMRAELMLAMERHIDCSGMDAGGGGEAHGDYAATRVEDQEAKVG